MRTGNSASAQSEGLRVKLEAEKKIEWVHLSTKITITLLWIYALVDFPVLPFVNVEATLGVLKSAVSISSINVVQGRKKKRRKGKLKILFS